jgi:hypothetical protein
MNGGLCLQSCVLTYNLLNYISTDGDLIWHKFEPHWTHATVFKTFQFVVLNDI